MDEPADDPHVGYRADIQGLRAVAVILVVVGHTGLALSGGFIGVDVFFVVSGFVIGRLLLAELTGTGGISLRRFYARRARRLLPALVTVILTTLAVGIVVLNPQSAQPTAFRTSLFASVFASNGYLYRHVGYFDADADAFNPFLHLWSLSVEEQFYVVLPLLLLVGWRFLGGRDLDQRRRRVAALVAALSLGSFVLSWVLTSGRGPTSIQAPVRLAFYGSPTRFWELGAGVVVALSAPVLLRFGSRAATALGAVGLAAIAVAALATDPLAPFPGVRALPPVLGTVAVLIAGARSPAVARPLSMAPLRWLGDRSYAWYLWHWPAIVYARVLWPGNRWAPAVAALFALAIAAATYAIIENPIRRTSSLVGGRAFRLAAVCTLVPLLAAVGAGRGAAHGWGVEVPTDWYRFPATRDNGCAIINRDVDVAWPAETCTIDPPSGEPSAGTVLVLGDQHADGVSTGVLAVAAERNLAVALWARSGCPFLATAPPGYPACETWQEQAIALVEDLDPVIVVIANRSTAYTTDPDPLLGASAGRITTSDGARTGSDEAAVVAWQEALGATVASIEGAGVPVLVVGPVPAYRTTFPRPSILRPDAVAPVVARASVDAVVAPLADAERSVVADAKNAAYIDAVAVLCGSTCSPVVGDVWTYLDAQQLNTLGSEQLIPAIEGAFDQLQVP